MLESFQPTLELSVPLQEVTFVVVDLETTGGSPRDSGITEIGAIRCRGGERLGVLHSLIDPSRPIPRHITHLTGIDDLMVAGEPSIEQVLPSFIEFARGAVFVAHNATFDFAFLDAQTQGLGYGRFPGPPVCTARLAGRVVWPDVPNVRLKTLSNYFRTRAKPSHRALDDAQACAEVLDGLLDLAGRLGITTLGDLHEALRAKGRPNYGKIRLSDHLPHAPGVYVFLGRDRRVLYVGKSKDLRARVRSYFYGDDRKRMEGMLAETIAVEGIVCRGELEALVVEARKIVQDEPKYNRRGKGWRRYAYLKIDTREALPRIKVVNRGQSSDGCYRIGPFGSSGAAHLAKEALEEVFPIRRCTAAMRADTRFPPCALSEIGRCVAPCDGRIDRERYGELVRSLLSSLSTPGELLLALERRMSRLAADERFEEAARIRDRLRSLVEALWRERQDGWLRRSHRIRFEDASGNTLEFVDGALVVGGSAAPLPTPVPRERADEADAVRAWLSRNPVRLRSSEAGLSEPVAGGREIAYILSALRASDARDQSASGGNGRDG